ncbi:MAG: hypothetical protein QG635_1540 [Bacteroidota bacterium]|nr:hypothetical protein [Bacteroidota bacterium]
MLNAQCSMVNVFNAGIDIGSTTAKLVVWNPEMKCLFSDYRRHHGKINEKLLEVILALKNKSGNINLSLAITGSAGMGVSEKLGLPFVQELVASADYATKLHPDIKTLIDIGGEDSKIIFFKESGADIRMNGSCAGGTGAFIDQMATLLNISVEEIDELAGNYRKIYPIASRCGVFAKTDVQNLLSREIPQPDIAASIFYAVALQIKNSLLRGFDAHPKVAFSGGPLSFLPELRKSVFKMFNFKKDDILYIENPELIPATGAALVDSIDRIEITIDELIESILSNYHEKISIESPLEPLFVNQTELEEWKKNKTSVKAQRNDLEKLDGQDCYLGIDSGSTTTKIVLTDKEGRIAFDFYANNGSNAIGAVRTGLQKLISIAAEKNINPKIKRSAVTGYGEDLIRSAFALDHGIVETLAHWRSASVFEPDVSFILDIGGQDMKAIFVRDGIIQNIEINEACSSGCGSFIETFANSLDYSVSKFAELACSASGPCDLGTRCTVFMNSRVKQSFREGNSVENISAGLAYSVIQNCLHKVLKIYDNSLLGNNIIVQGGTFRNAAVHRAFEKVLGKEVICPDISELMGAYGAALTAQDYDKQNREKLGTFDLKENMEQAGNYKVKYLNCKGCENTCTISKLTFDNGNIFYTGNRCERIFTNHGNKNEKGANLPSIKYELLFNRQSSPDGKPLLTIGIPRALNIYENYPFWAKLFVECGIEVKLSAKSNSELCDTGAGTVVSDNICFPAKLTHGHIMNLIEAGVSRIFYPIVTYEADEFPETNNCFNCPVVSGYPEVIKSSINPMEKYGIPLDSPNITFKAYKLLKEACYKYLKSFGISQNIFNKALKAALIAQIDYKKTIRLKAKDIIENASTANRKIIVLAGRPYHIDPLINHNLPDIIADFGVDVLTDDAIPYNDGENLADLNILSQWAYPNRMFRLAKWVGNYNNIELVQLNNFGCGPDTIAIEEIKEILEDRCKYYTVIRIDEHASTGSLKLRVRSLIESLKIKDASNSSEFKRIERRTTLPFMEIDKDKLILLPYFSPFHSSYVSAPFSAMGYKVELLPQSDQESVDLGLKYVNNEICYPAILVIGDVLKALKSGKYDLSNIAVAMSQTGGQCRASNYLSLLKKALVKNGYGNIPVVGVSLSNRVLNYQPGFEINKTKLTVQGVIGILFGDAISKMYYSIAPREKNKGEAALLAEKYNKLAYKGIEESDADYLVKILKHAIEDFNNIELIREDIRRVGIVGEIYVKYNPIGNRNLVNELIERGVEPVMPPLINMFTQWFENVKYKNSLGLEKNPLSRALAYVLEKYYNIVSAKFERAMTNFRFYTPTHSIRHIAENAEKVMNMANHYFGEGWLIAGDILSFAEDGINDVLCLQPFGCIANHIVARGVEKALKEQEPSLNILYLDIDAGVSDVNLHNRLYLLLRNMKGKVGHVNEKNRILINEHA